MTRKDKIESMFITILDVIKHICDKKMVNEKIHFNLVLNSDMEEAIEKAAKEESRTKTSFILWSIKSYLKNKEEKKE